MTTIGYGLILIGALLIRQVAVGRAANTASDARDMFVAVLRGDLSGLKTVASQRGTVSTSAVGTSVAGAALGVASAIGAGQLEMEMRSLASQVGNRYLYGGASTSQGGFDCSGLVWRAMYDLGIYKGPRFTADSTFLSALHGHITQTNSPQRGDIVLWSGYHMGIVVSPDVMYSALNSTDGITQSSISQFRALGGSTPAPTFWHGDW